METNMKAEPESGHFIFCNTCNEKIYEYKDTVVVVRPLIDFPDHIGHEIESYSSYIFEKRDLPYIFIGSETDIGNSETDIGFGRKNVK